MKRQAILALALLSLSLVGCKEAVVATSSSTVTPTATTTTATQKQEVPPPPVPEELKTEAYHYYGLGNDKPVNLVISVQGGEKYDGAQIIHEKSVDKGKVLYEIERTGGLGEQLGSDMVTLGKEGIYVIKSTKYTTDSSNLDMPSAVPPGATWKNQGKLTMSNGQKFEQNMSFKVIGESKITTLAGAQTALLIKASGEVKIDTQKYRMEQSQWYVKDKGLVKSEIRLTDVSKPKALPQVISIQETNK